MLGPAVITFSCSQAQQNGATADSVPPALWLSLAKEPSYSATALRAFVSGKISGALWLDDLVSGRVGDTREIATQESCSGQSVRMNLNLPFLNPAIVTAAVEGSLPFGTGLSRLAILPPDWQQQMEGLHWRSGADGRVDPLGS